MRPGEAVSDGEMQVMREHASNGVDRFYNWKDGKRLFQLPDGSNLHIGVNFVEDPAAADVVIDIECPYNPMTGARDKWTHQTRWLTDDAAEDMAAHEVSHQLGILDEYHDPFGSPNRAVIDDESLMGDFANYDSPSIKQRHIDQIGGDIDQA